MLEEEKRENNKIEEGNKIKERTREEKNRTAYKVVNETLLREHAFWSKEPLGKKQTDFKDSKKEQTTTKDAQQKIVVDGAPGRDTSELSLRTVEIPSELSSVTALLMNHYIEDSTASFSLQYSQEFLKWQLSSPSVFPGWNVGMYDGSELVGFISAAAINIRIKESRPKTAVVNFLCIHKEYRKRRLAPVLIKEVTRRVNEEGIYTALFTSGEKLPYIFTRSRYYHKILRKGDLVESGFCHPEDVSNITKDMLSQDSPTVHFRKAADSDLPHIFEMYCDKYSKMDISANYTYEQFEYYVYNRDRVSDLLISDDGSEFVSIFYLDTRSAKTDSRIKTAYLSYHNMKNGTGSMLGLVDYLLKMDECDVLNALEIEHNTESLLRSVGFIKGDGVINYYLFNWDTEIIPACRNSFITS
ncbi:glycylpeptide N-tetradecanoyltransferase [Nematocida minor]|uniref:glycylpeptide N-tetradecanoyltransferase n=1 Tax=Nematocida minor TaxID=1912983 RepID=UPI00221F0AEC|nr:glycylpeptide N-tetradecanoyltransferase [Nematocida minor]KAI5190206.1 glycylpeptide N-tetradecanoyltransferase [Nematocida minor]